jgi:hypothetical protein
MVMLRFTTSTRLGAALAALVVVGTLQAEPPRRRVSTTQPAVHQMELLNGATRTVRSFGIGLSTGEAASLADLDRIENEAAFAHDVQALKRQYVSSERLLEPHRRNIQQDLYGRVLTTNNADSLNSSAILGTNPYGVGSVAGLPLGGYGVGGFGVGGFGYNGPAVVTTGSASTQTTEVNSLSPGVGDEGPLKAAFAAVIAKQAAPGYSAAVATEYRRAVATAATSPRLRAGLRLRTPDELRKEDNAIRAADFETPIANRVTLTLANGNRVVGTNLREDKEWITLERADGGTSRYRPTQVVQIDMPRTGGKVKPAADE